MNNLKVAILMTALMALFLAIGYLVGGQGGLVIAFVLATVMNFVSYWYSDKIVLKMYKARLVDEKEHSRLYRIVKTVAMNAMIPVPKIYIVPSKAPNAFATGRNIENSAVAATEGLLEILNDRELEGVFGHEIAHIQNKDMLIGTIAATFAGAITILASIARWGAIFGGGGRSGDRGGGLNLIIVALLAPVAAMVIQVAISRQREYKADAEGGRMTNRYLDLASALKKLHATPLRMNLDKNPATAHMMIANPLSGKRMTSLFSTHPPVEKRIERLNKLAQESIYAGYEQKF
jgi:heat shock protein HtpX